MTAKEKWDRTCFQTRSIVPVNGSKSAFIFYISYRRGLGVCKVFSTKSFYGAVDTKPPEMLPKGSWHSVLCSEKARKFCTPCSHDVSDHNSGRA